MEARSFVVQFHGDAAEPRAESAALEQIRANAAEASVLSGCADRMSAATSPGTGLPVAAACIRQLTPATVLAFYRYNSATDSLVCEESAGDPNALLQGLVIRVGERVTGWTAANHRTSVNSHATLDLTQLADEFQPRLRSTISTPLLHGSSLLGVLTAYSTKENAFNDSHRYSFEYVASLLTRAVSSRANTSLIPFTARNT
jgi:GAF domain-containing protein